MQVESLTPRQKRIVILDRIGLSQAKTADMLGMSRRHFNRLLNQEGKHPHFDRRLYGLLRSQRVKAERGERGE